MDSDPPPVSLLVGSQDGAASAHDELIINDRSGRCSTHSIPRPRNILQRPSDATLTLRSVVAGLLIGSLICFASVYYGLQADQSNSMPLPSALLGYAIVHPLSKRMQAPFNPSENVLVMTVAASMGGIPTTAGLCGTIPALEYLVPREQNGPLVFTLREVVLWSLSVCLFGIVVATPFRKQFVLRSKLRFPTGTAMATVISMLHGRADIMERIKRQQADEPRPQQLDHRVAQSARTEAATTRAGETPFDTDTEILNADPQRSSFRPNEGASEISKPVLTSCFAMSSLLALITFLAPSIEKLPIFGLDASRNWAWAVELSPAYVGYGMIMDPMVTAHMMLGAVIGWGILSPLAKSKGWAPGPVEDWENGSQGWTVWVALGVIFGDSVVGICSIVIGSLRPKGRPSTGNASDLLRIQDDYTIRADEGTPLLPRPDKKNACESEVQSIPGIVVALSLAAATLFCFGVTWYLFHGLLNVLQILMAIAVILPLGIASIRSMGETDNSLASSLGKASQFLFALVQLIPASNHNAIIASLLVGGIAEGGAYQSSDVMEHLKTGHLVGASPTGLFEGQIIGSIAGAALSSCIYKLYTSAGTLPNQQFPIPNAQLWIATVNLIYGKGLPKWSWAFSLTGFVCSALFAIAKGVAPRRRWSHLIPSGIALGIGIYVRPAYTIPQALGGLIHYLSKRMLRKGELPVITIAIALILGETLVNVAILVIRSLGV